MILAGSKWHTQNRKIQRELNKGLIYKGLGRVGRNRKGLMQSLGLAWQVLPPLSQSAEGREW